jgi:hypothetical protein
VSAAQTAAGESISNFRAEERDFRLRQQTDCGHPESDTTSGLVAYLDGEPVGWCAVEPRTAYKGLVRKPWHALLAWFPYDASGYCQTVPLTVNAGERLRTTRPPA